MQPNTLYYGDNLSVLRAHFPDACVDLVYLDPPFNSNRSYNVLFKEMAMGDSPAQIEAFEDTWHWGESAQRAFEEVALHGSDNTARLLKAMVDALGHNDVTAYLCMMAMRLVELRRVLELTGSIYLHCDPTASHYLKMLMDSIFGAQKFRNEIIWWYRKWSKSNHQFLRNHDVLLFYAKGPGAKFNILRVPRPRAPCADLEGKRQDFADDSRTRKITTDEDSLAGCSVRRLGYQLAACGICRTAWISDSEARGVAETGSRG